MIESFSLELFIIIFTALSSFLLGGIVLLRDTKSATNVAFFALTFIISSWLVTNYFSLHSPTPEETLFWIRTVMSITAFLGTTLFFFLYSYPKRKSVLSPVLFWGMLGGSIVVSIISQTPLLFSSVTIENGNISPKPGILFPLYLLIFLPPIIAGFITLFIKYRKSAGIEKLQIKYLFVGSAITFALLTFTNLFMVAALNSSQLVFFGPVFSLIMLGSIAYAIVKHRLLNISSLIARTFSYTLVLLLISILYVGIFFGIAYQLFPALFENRETTIILSTFLALITAVTLPSLRGLVERTTDKLFYKNKTDERRLMNLIAELITSTFELNILATQSIQILENELRITYARLILYERNSPLIFESSTKTDDAFEETDNTLLHSLPDITVFEELPDGKIKDWMHTNEIAVIVRLEVKSEAMGYLLLGNKSSGEIFYENDLSLLPTVADQLAVSFENALGVEKISRFNETLKHEVEKATADLKTANEELKQLDKVKDEFLSMASHELKSPMNAVKNYLWMAMNKGKDHPEKMDEYLHIAYESTQRLISMVNDLLDVSRIESGRISLNIQSLKLPQIVNETVEIYEPAAKTKNIILKLTPIPEISILADDEKLREVLSNLISNAVKYTLKGSVTISVEEKEKIVRILITDTGMGIGKEDQKKLFQKFSRVNSSYKQMASIEGTGLGLYICKQFVEMMNGKIGFSSEFEKGSTFWFELPKA